MPEQLVWLITGCSSGLGLSLARAALAAGHKVVATSRNPANTPEVVDEITSNENGAWTQLDVAAQTLEQDVEACFQNFGRVDVIVNNAGYGSGGALEDMAMAEARRVMETNFFGPARIMKAAIPLFRAQGSGTFINISSTEGTSAVPGLSMSAASKFALEAVSESMFSELAAFGIRTLIVEPGGMRTNFLDSGSTHLAPMSEPFKGGVVEHVQNAVLAQHGKQMLNPDRSAKRIVEAVDGTGKGWPEKREQYLRLPLGKQAIGRMRGKIDNLQKDMEAVKEIWGSVDFDA